MLRERVALLREAETWSAEQHREYQLGELRRVLLRVQQHVPHYRRQFQDIGFDPEAVCSLEDIQALPLLAKETVRDNISSFLADDCDASTLIEMTTGGSTGNPMRVPWDQRFYALNTANTYYYLSVAGFTPGMHRSIRLHGDPIPNDHIDAGEYWMTEGLRLTLSVHHISDETVAGFVNQIDAQDPEYIHAYPSALFILCECMERNRLHLKARIKAVFCDSETLYSWQRERFETLFGCKVYGIYGHTEGAVCAITYPDSDDLHLLPEVGFTEIIDSDGTPVTTPGGSGEIVVSGFNSTVFPLIRYRTGDIGTISDTPDVSGRHHPRLSQIEGRIQDFVIDRNGQQVAIAPALFDYHFDWSGIDRFQIHQKARGELLFRLVLAKTKQPGGGDIAARVVSEFGRLLNREFNISAEIVDEIPLTPRGKFRYVEQELSTGA